MTDIDTAELRGLLAKATPGEWGVHSLPQSAQIWANHRSYVGETRDYTGDDAALIVALHNAAPALLDEIDRLRAELAAEREAHGRTANIALTVLRTAHDDFHHATADGPAHCAFTQAEIDRAMAVITWSCAHLASLKGPTDD